MRSLRDGEKGLTLRKMCKGPAAGRDIFGVEKTNTKYGS